MEHLYVSLITLADSISANIMHASSVMKSTNKVDETIPHDIVGLLAKCSIVRSWKVLHNSGKDFYRFDLLQATKVGYYLGIADVLVPLCDAANATMELLYAAEHNGK